MVFLGDNAEMNSIIVGEHLDIFFSQTLLKSFELVAIMYLGFNNCMVWIAWQMYNNVRTNLVQSGSNARILC